MSDEQKKKISETLTGSHHSSETKQKMSRARKGRKKSRRHISAIRKSHVKRVKAGKHKGAGGRAKRGVYTSSKTGITEQYHSSYELRRMQALDASPLVKSWTKDHGIRIPYKERRRRRHYIPDFLVELTDGRRRLEETKGYVFSKMNFARKNLAAFTYCRFRGLEFCLIFREDLDVVT